MLIIFHDLMGVWCSSINPKSSEDYFSDFFTHIWENVVVVHLDSHVRLFATLWTAACQPSLSFTISQSLLKLMSIEWMMPFSHLILCLSLLLQPTESLRLQGDQTGQSERKSTLNIHWKDWCWIWSSNTLATWCEELTHWKRPWCWERLKAGGEGDDRGWDGWMVSPTQWTWAWVNSRS